MNMSARRINQNRQTRLKTDDIDTPTEINLPGEDDESLWHDPFVHILLILAAGFIAYFNSISSPFVFDDFGNIVDNLAIRSFKSFPNIMQFFGFTIDREIALGYNRPIGILTFCLNYAIHGLDHFGYHITNLLLHISNAMMVYLIFSRIQATPLMLSSAKNDPVDVKSFWYLPLFAALVFISHPIQTQSVTYIVQRYVPLATFFYLGALILYEIYRSSQSQKIRTIAYIASLAATILAMGSKEIAFTLPVVILLYELMFYQGKLTSRLFRLIPFILTMSTIPLRLLQVASLRHAQMTEGLPQGVMPLPTEETASAFDYLLTQFGVIVTYIRLLFLPVGQNLDYDYPLQTVFFSLPVLLPLLLLLALAGSGFWFLLRSRDDRHCRIAAFGIFWFFITLSVESSVNPIKDLIFEHRIYLPSIGFIMAFFAAVAIFYRRYTDQKIYESKSMTSLFFIIVLILSVTTVFRNRVWESDVALWRDVVSKSPNKSRVHTNLGAAINMSLQVAKRDNPVDKGLTILSADKDKLLDEAIFQYNESIRLNPREAYAYFNLAKSMVLKNNYDEALKYVASTIQINQFDPAPFVLRGDIYVNKGKFQDAEQAYREAIKIQSTCISARWGLANLMSTKGNIPEAIKELEALKLIYTDETVTKRLEELKGTK